MPFLLYKLNEALTIHKLCCKIFRVVKCDIMETKIKQVSK